MDFKEVYYPPSRLPFEDSIKVFCGSFTSAFDFMYPWHKGEDMIFLGPKSKQEFVDILNGESNKEFKAPLKREGCEIWIGTTEGWKKLLRIRGWGHLTGCGGLNLDAEVAAKIQDDFGDWIIQTFTEKK